MRAQPWMIYLATAVIVGLMAAEVMDARGRGCGGGGRGASQGGWGSAPVYQYQRPQSYTPAQAYPVQTYQDYRQRMEYVAPDHRPVPALPPSLPAPKLPPPKLGPTPVPDSEVPEAAPSPPPAPAPTIPVSIHPARPVAAEPTKKPGMEAGLIGDWTGGCL